jgi:cell division protein FtsB
MRPTPEEQARMSREAWMRTADALILENKRLEAELAQARAEIVKLTKERDALVKERSDAAWREENLRHELEVARGDEWR